MKWPDCPSLPKLFMNQLDWILCNLSTLSACSVCNAFSALLKVKAAVTQWLLTASTKDRTLHSGLYRAMLSPDISPAPGTCAPPVRQEPQVSSSLSMVESPWKAKCLSDDHRRSQSKSKYLWHFKATWELIDDLVDNIMLLKRLKENQWMSQEHMGSMSQKKDLSSSGHLHPHRTTTEVVQARAAWRPGREQLQIRSESVTKRNVLLCQRPSNNKPNHSCINFLLWSDPQNKE